MKFNCGETWTEQKARLEQWHRWFAWYPVKISNHDCRWFETIERRGTFWSPWGDAFWHWTYRVIENGR